jgi:hypothetical protein
MCRVVDAPWRMPQNLEDMKAFFNYDLNLHKWREYCKRVEQYRLQYTMQVTSHRLPKTSLQPDNMSCTMQSPRGTGQQGILPLRLARKQTTSAMH